MFMQISKIIKQKLNWNQILIRSIRQFNKSIDKSTDDSNDSAIIEYLDTEETDTIMIAMSQDNLLYNKRENDTFQIYTHCEIHPSLIYDSCSKYISP